MPCHRQASAPRWQRLLREHRGHQRPQVWGTHIPYIKQTSLGLCKFNCRVQPLYKFSCLKLQRQALQPAVQDEYVLPDVGCYYA